MQSNLPMYRAKRCLGLSKRSGSACQSPAVQGFNVCRMHGARSGAPKGNKNAHRHELCAGSAVTEHRASRALLSHAEP